MHPALIRARQIKALYQRELTALNRNRHLSEEARAEQAERLWRQANDQIERIRLSLGSALGAFSEEEQALFDPPKRPPYLSASE